MGVGSGYPPAFVAYGGPLRMWLPGRYAACGRPLRGLCGGGSTCASRLAVSRGGSRCEPRWVAVSREPRWATVSRGGPRWVAVGRGVLRCVAVSRDALRWAAVCRGATR